MLHQRVLILAPSNLLGSSFSRFTRFEELSFPCSAAKDKAAQMSALKDSFLASGKMQAQAMLQELEIQGGRDRRIYRVTACHLSWHHRVLRY